MSDDAKDSLLDKSFLTPSSGLHLGGQPIQIEVGGGRWSVLEPRHLRDQVRFRAHHIVHLESFLALTDEEKAVIHEALMLYDFIDAANGGGSREGIRVDDAEAEVCLKECVHHDVVAELKDLQGGDGAKEEHQRERKERKIDDVIGVGGVRVVLLGEGRGRVAESGIKLPAAVAENGEIEMVLVVQRNEDYGLGEKEMKIVVWGKCRQRGGRRVWGKKGRRNEGVEKLF
ncbi:hypothetical protein VIGAN_09059800 [Vigna angularis var. angularis]|uniref:Uncharacterized protein n=1 Tax=Vigna angularis var. angularis TaxID=157739 RepID=A0A0S3SWX2_PHAAN|nr:hypothetical protein VIGAN_09059800 [Vigna angularis var. angularis]